MQYGIKYRYMEWMLALQKMRWIGNNVIRIGNYKFFCSGGQKHILGVRFAVHKPLHGDIEFRPITTEYVLLEFVTKHVNARY
ncbi:craniofacial development protein 2-like protein [Lasius niger]|uniref:Craniofacial development protein 2-like protein n=1 Tax=Lasius niger TaxID=67767 RepID=A0A0J7KR57_LASNI|nr:craniofacial development protein 2-like protein [Lasius niger]